MPENLKDKKVYSLLEVTASIQRTLKERYTSSFWIKAEIIKVNYYPLSGHCYPDLIEKKNGKVIAAIRSTLWKDDYERINKSFLKVLNEPLTNGITVLLCAKVMYDPVRGISLRIFDIDPGYTLGELEREKANTIARLKEEGVYDLNKSLKIAVLPKRIAVISVATSKGYQDFIKIIERNGYGYRFFHMLFPALLQGEKAVESIKTQLQKIKKVIRHFDVVAIVRGGGDDVSLTCYNDYNLTKDIASFPIPVITGIGHSTNETVTEMIAFENAITPTDLADFLIRKFSDFAGPVTKYEEVITDKAHRLLQEENRKLYNSVRYLKSVTGSVLMKNNFRIANNQNTLLQSAAFLCKSERESQRVIITSLDKYVGLLFCDVKAKMKSLRTDLSERALNAIRVGNVEIGNYEKSINMLSPDNVIKRGYSINLVNGKVVKSIEQLNNEDLLTIITADGRVISKVNIISKQGET